MCYQFISKLFIAYSRKRVRERERERERETTYVIV